VADVRINLPMKKIEDFCQKWKIQEFALFGSVLRDDFNPLKSDIDILVLFDEESQNSLFDLVKMKGELEDIFQKVVDLVSKRGIEESNNPYRKKAILDNYEVIYERAA